MASFFYELIFLYIALAKKLTNVTKAITRAKNT